MEAPSAMAVSPSARRRAPRPIAILGTLAAAAAGGGLFAAFGLPAAWISGALTVVAVLALFGVGVAVNKGIRGAAFIGLGITMGAAVTPETLMGMRNWPISIAVLLLSVAATMAAVTFYLRRFSGWDGRTAFYASAPGALSTALALATQDGADVRRVAFAQAIRLFLLIAVLPGTLASLGLSMNVALPMRPPLQGSIGIGAAGELALMAIAGIAGGLAAERARMPGGLLFGAMFASAILHATGLVAVLVPPYVLIPCFIALGASVGSRFAGSDLATLKHFLFASLGAFVVASSVSLAFALLASGLSGEAVGKTIVAFAPGGVEAMTALAFVIGLDPAFVAAHHIVRFLLIGLLLPFAARLLFGPAPASQDPAV
jgi:membrane AbrB-like protein